jgi:hypothetical protein
MDQAMGTNRSYERDDDEEEGEFEEHPADAWKLQRVRFLAHIAALNREDYWKHPANAWELQRLRRLAQLAAREKYFWEHPAIEAELQRLRRLQLQGGDDRPERTQCAI